MGDKTQKPLTLEDAKQRLRKAASDMSMGARLQRHPLETLAIAFALGMILADRQRAKTLLLATSLLSRLDFKGW